MPIPKLIHYLWIDESCTGIPADIENNLQSWRDTHPDFIQKVWSMDMLEVLLENFHGMNILKCVKECRFPAMQSDIIRLALVYEYGGYWNDLKNYALSPCLHRYQNNNELLLVEHQPLPQRPDPVDYLCNSFFAAPERNKFILDVLKEIYKNVNNKKEGSVFSISGGDIFMKLLRRSMNNSTPYNYTLIKHKDFWGLSVKRTTASYNIGNTHWSIRQKTESLYI